MFTAPAATLAGMFRCEATTDTGERLTLYGHCQTPQVALRMVLADWRHLDIDVQAVTIYRCTPHQGRPMGKPVVTWERPR